MPAPNVERLTLYGSSVSGNCLKPKWTADRLGVEYDWVEVDLLAGETRTEAFLAMNPTGQVPFARWPDGRALPQSNAIMLHLAQVHGDGALVPAEAFAHAQMMSWLFWEQNFHEPSIAVRRWQKRLGKTDDELDPAWLRKGNDALAIMQMQLSWTDWLVGKELSVADIALVAYTRLAPEGGFDLSKFPAVQAWVGRVEKELGIGSALTDSPR